MYIPSYLQKIQEDWLARQVDGEPTIEIDTTMTEIINNAHADNPFSTMAIPDQDSAFDRMDEVVEDFAGKIDVLLSSAEIDKATELSTSAATRALEKFGLPRFDAGMRNINAVNSSAFVVGRAVIISEAAEKAGAVASGMYQTLFSTQWDAALKELHYRLEVIRMRTATAMEIAEKTNALMEHEARWPLEVFSYGGNLMASVSGGTVPMVSQQSSSGLSMLGGALQGASLGMQIGGSFSNDSGGNYGGIGAIIGGIAGIFA